MQFTKKSTAGFASAPHLARDIKWLLAASSSRSYAWARWRERRDTYIKLISDQSLNWRSSFHLDFSIQVVSNAFKGKVGLLCFEPTLILPVLTLLRIRCSVIVWFIVRFLKSLRKGSMRCLWTQRLKKRFKSRKLDLMLIIGTRMEIFWHSLSQCSNDEFLLNGRNQTSPSKGENTSGWI